MGKGQSSRDVADLAPDPCNPRRITDEAAAGLGESMRRFGDIALIVWNRKTGHLVAGHQRMAQLRAAGATQWTLDGDRGFIEHPVTGERFSVRVVDWDETTERAANLVANSPTIAGEFTEDAMRQLEEIAAQGVDLGPLRLDALMDELREAFPPEAETDTPRPTLAERFGVPPFSVLDARQGYWQERKQAWIALGIKSELGRGNSNLGMSHPATTGTIDFYAQKRCIEAELGREISTDEAKQILVNRGRLIDPRSDNAQRIKRRGGGNAAIVNQGAMAKLQQQRRGDSGEMDEEGR